MATKIYEDKHIICKVSNAAMSIMTEEQKERGRYYLDKYTTRKAEFEKLRSEFDAIQDMCACNREPDVEDPSYPNNFIPLITPIIEGQVAAMLESDTDYNYISNNPLHKQFLPQLESAGAYVRNINQANLKYKDYTREYLKLGNAWLTPMWEKTYSHSGNRPKGYPKIVVPDIGTVFVDGKIKDYKDLQDAEYIIHELGYQDIAWARKQYGDEKAEALRQGAPIPAKGEVFRDDIYTFTLLHVWTRNNEQENLQLIEMDTNGFILRESDPATPYYTMVGNQYPFYFGRMLPRPGSFYGHGDGKILKYMQTYMNRLADEMELAARFNAQPKTFISPKCGLDPKEYNSDPSKPIMIDNPRENVLVVQGQGINPVVPAIMQSLIEHTQRSTRFSDIMTGNQQGVSATATQISGQLSQGLVGIKDKAADIQLAMAWCDRYCLQLCLQKWDVPFWATKFRSAKDQPEEGSEWLDMQSIARVPAAVPMTAKSAVKRMWEKVKNPNAPVVDYDVVMKNKKATLIDLDYDVRVKLAADLPRGKNDLFNQMIALMQLVVMDENGQPKQFLDTAVATEKMEQILGFKLNVEAAKNDPLLNANKINPIGASGEVAQPQGSQVRTQPSNLMGTVPLAPKDTRGVQM